MVRYVRESDRFAAAFRRTSAGLRDLQRPTGTERARALERLGGVESVADQAAEDVLQAALDAGEALSKANLAVVATLDEYALNDSSSVPPASGWSNDTPDWVDGQFVWRRTRSTLANGSVQYGSPAVMTGSSGEDAVLLRVYSSLGTVFKNTQVATTLTARVYVGGTEVTGGALTALGTVKWYKDGVYLTGKDGVTLTVAAGDVADRATYEARLEN